MEKKRHLFDIQMNSIVDTDNPTKKEVEFILHGFDVSHNYAFISKSSAGKTLHTLKGMPIVARYYDKSSYENDDDALGSHEVQLEEDRETGDAIVTMGTVPIGVFTEDAYITTIQDENGNQKEVVSGKGILWASRFPNVIGLLEEWMDKGVPVVSSMEILYDSYKVVDGITEILNYVYEGHAILNSEERGHHKKVYPAYDESKLTKLVAEAMTQNNVESKEVNEMEEKELVQEEAVEVEEKQVSEEVVEETVVENVQGEVEQVEESSEEVLEEDEEVKTLQNEITQLKEQLSSVEEKFNEATEKLTQLNSLVEELKPYKEQVDKESFQKSLSEKKDFYSKKFSALKASEKFESEEVQGLVEKSVFENEEGKQAVLQLNSILVELVEIVIEEKQEEPVIREVSSKRENLIPASDDFESRYSL